MPQITTRRDLTTRTAVAATAAHHGLPRPFDAETNTEVWGRESG